MKALWECADMRMTVPLTPASAIPPGPKKRVSARARKESSSEEESACESSSSSS